MGLKKTDPEAMLTETDIKTIKEIETCIMKLAKEDMRIPAYKGYKRYPYRIFENETLNDFAIELLYMLDSIVIDKSIADFVTTVGNKLEISVPVVWKEE